MKEGSCSIFCTGTFMSHHDSALFQKAGTTGLSTGSLSCLDVLYLSPGAPPEFPPSYLLPHLDFKLFLFFNPNLSLNMSFICMQSQPALAGVAQWIEPQGHWFSSQSGYVPGLRAGSPVGSVREAADLCFSRTTLFLSFSLSLKMTKVFLKTTIILSILTHKSFN